jgi:isopenicillin-N epimerase
MVQELPSALRHAAARLAAFLRAKGEDVVFVENATAGCNAVLNSVPLVPGDEILVTDLGYPAIRNAAEHACRRTGAGIVEAPIPFPVHEAAIILRALEAALGPRTRLAIIDHVSSPTGLVFPIREMISLCHAAGTQVLVDGAHGPGMLPLDVPSLGADWYVGNCHKWLMAPKGSAFLWASGDAKRDLHPPVISLGYEQDFLTEFDWTGTRDYTAWLSVPAAIDVHERLGGRALQHRNKLLICAAARLLEERWRTLRGVPDALTGSMAAVRLPTRWAASTRLAREIQNWLLTEHRIEVAVTLTAGSLWARVSAQAYNSLDDYDRLAAVVASHRW